MTHTSIGMWKGKPIEDHTKEELIEMVRHLIIEQGAINADHLRRLDMLTKGPGDA